MARINVLDRRVAELIAAGEVVERPSSVVKELVENSVDAGATAITVEIKNGGITYLRVTDNGEGIEREELPKAFLRHATSKVSEAEDLTAIRTLGFRGEALASIAAMCRVEVLTRTANEESGSRYTIEGGQELGLESAGCPVGTTIVVRDIFYNTPARMKFLKKDLTEAGSVAGVLDRVALSHPEVSVKFIRDGQIRLHTPGDGKLYSAVYAVLGREFAQGLTEVAYQVGGLEVSGYISKPECARANRSMQHFFINDRIVRSGSCTAALEEAYRNSVMVGKFPGCVLKLHIPYHVVDVNVHPAKIEVRFSDEKAVFDLVYYGCKNALQALRPVASAQDAGLKALKINPLNVTTPPTSGSQQVFSSAQYRELISPTKPQNMRGFENVKQNNFTQKVTEKLQSLPLADEGLHYQIEKKLGPTPSAIHSYNQAAEPVPSYQSNHHAELGVTGQGSMKIPDESPAPAAQPFNEMHSPAAIQPLSSVSTATLLDETEQALPTRVIGQVFDTYILVEQNGELVLIDKHAAHERLLFEEVRAGTDSALRQMLLSPVPVRLSREAYTTAVSRLEEFERLGILADDFGDGTLLIREAPMLLDKEDIFTLVEEIAHSLQQSQNDLTPHALNELYHSVACKAAIKGGQFSSMEEMKSLVARLEQTGGIRHCPHGRPVAVSFTKYDLEKLFGRRT